MLANFFGKSNPANFIIIFLIFLGFFLAKNISLYPISSINFSLIVHQISILVLFLLMFFCYNFILAKNKLTLYNSYGFLLFVLFFGFYPETLLDRNAIIFNLLVIVFLRKIFSLSSSNILYNKMIDSGFWLGILFLFEPTSVVFGILIFLAIGLFQKITLRTFLIPVIGFLVPVFLYFTYFFWFDNMEEFTKLFLYDTDHNFKIVTTNPILFSSVFLGSLTIISILVKTSKVILIRGVYRKYWILIIFNFVIAISLFIIHRNQKGFEMILLFFPTSIIIANWLETIKKSFLKNLLLALLILTPVILFIV
mgnify:FL=1|tara:strand:+ start:1509 stop:2435 length:927 start_codon:yes stop_codon:yes gene_type:complete